MGDSPRSISQASTVTANGVTRKIEVSVEHEIYSIEFERVPTTSPLRCPHCGRNLPAGPTTFTTQPSET